MFKRITFGLAALLAIPHLAPAQPGIDSWDNLGRLRPGQKIEVVDVKMKPLQGVFAGFTAAEISVVVDGVTSSVPRASVASVKDRQGARRGRNALQGLAVGAGVGAIIGAILGRTTNESGETGFLMGLGMASGAGIGAGVGAALPAANVTVYRVKKPPAR